MTDTTLSNVIHRLVRKIKEGRELSRGEKRLFKDQCRAWNAHYLSLGNKRLADKFKKMIQWVRSKPPTVKQTVDPFDVDSQLEDID